MSGESTQEESSYEESSYEDDFEEDFEGIEDPLQRDEDSEEETEETEEEVLPAPRRRISNPFKSGQSQTRVSLPSTKPSINPFGSTTLPPAKPLSATTTTTTTLPPAKPLSAKPLSAKPLLAKPLSAKPLSAKPLSAKPPPKPLSATTTTTLSQAKPLLAKPVSEITTEKIPSVVITLQKEPGETRTQFEFRRIAHDDATSRGMDPIAADTLSRMLVNAVYKTCGYSHQIQNETINLIQSIVSKG